MYKNILIATDGSELSAKATDYAIKLAKAVGAQITGVTVTTPFPIMAVEPGFVALPKDYFDNLIKYADDALAQVRSAAAKAGVKCDVVRIENAHAYSGIIDTAKNQRCDLIVMASHGRRGFEALLIGSETLKVLTHSEIPVLVYRE